MVFSDLVTPREGRSGGKLQGMEKRRVDQVSVSHVSPAVDPEAGIPLMRSDAASIDALVPPGLPSTRPLACSGRRRHARRLAEVGRPRPEALAQSGERGSRHPQ